MAQPASKVDTTDIQAYLEGNPVFRLCRARRHRWPDPETSVRKINALWDWIYDAAPGEPNAVLIVECERGCGNVLIKHGLADLKAETFEVVKKRIVPPEEYLAKGTRIYPAQAEESLALSHFRLLAEREKTQRTPPAAARAKPGKRLRAVS